MTYQIPTITKYASELTPHPDNYNTHPKSQIAQLAESLTTFGQFKNLVVWTCPQNMTTDEGVELHEGVCYILAGHGLWLAAMEAGLDQLEVKDYSGLSYEMALSLLMVDNAAPLGSEPDAARLAQLLERTRALVADKPGLAGMLETLRQRAGVNGKGQAGNDVEPQIDKAQQLKEKWGVELGQLWQLGEHRVICGDCTDRAVVEAVMRGDILQLLLTDIPYDVAQGGRHDSYNSDLTQTKDTNFEKFDKDFDPLPFLNLWLDLAPELANWFIYVGALFQGTKVYQVLDPKLDICSAWVWVKKFAVHNVRGVGFAKAYEMAIYGWNKGHFFNPLFGVDGYDYGIYASNEGGRSYDHPTGKPIALIERHIEQLSESGSIVTDPFLGSGTTLIACENLSRRCRAIELDPGYVAVTLQRWADLTGLTPTLVSG